MIDFKYAHSRSERKSERREREMANRIDRTKCALKIKAFNVYFQLDRQIQNVINGQLPNWLGRALAYTYQSYSITSNVTVKKIFNE